MKTPMFVIPALALAGFGCNTKFSSNIGDPNSPVAAAVDQVTTALFDAEQPTINAAIATLPADAQALAQLAYVALEQAVKAAEQQGMRMLAVSHDGTIQSVAAQLNDVKEILHATIHDPNGQVTTIVTDGNTGLPLAPK